MKVISESIVERGVLISLLVLSSLFSLTLLEFGIFAVYALCLCCLTAAVLAVYRLELYRLPKASEVKIRNHVEKAKWFYNVILHNYKVDTFGMAVMVVVATSLTVLVALLFLSFSDVNPQELFKFQTALTLFVNIGGFLFFASFVRVHVGRYKSHFDSVEKYCIEGAPFPCNWKLDRMQVASYQADCCEDMEDDAARSLIKEWVDLETIEAYGKGLN